MLLPLLSNNDEITDIKIILEKNRIIDELIATNKEDFLLMLYPMIDTEVIDNKYPIFIELLFLENIPITKNIYGIAIQNIFDNIIGL